jgi:hypothetical protein
MEASLDLRAHFVDESIHPVLVPLRQLKGLARQKSLSFSQPVAAQSDFEEAK